MKSVCYVQNHPLRLFFYDFDGVLTDNKVFVSEDGKESVCCNRSDGLAIKKIKEMGIAQMIISTETNKIVSARAAKLDIPVIQGVANKKETLLEYCEKLSVNLKETLYIGNDINDLEAMLAVGFPVCPKDAYPEIKKIAKLVIPVSGGDGVIRELLYYLELRVDSGISDSG
ncbi:MAG: HAD hydrolase family protein [Treponema sp.]|nr:HAD hydrolase family protein [Treponema sp.]